MKSFLYTFAAFILVLLSSCGGDNKNNAIDEPDIPEQENKFPTELVGTWMYYSGTSGSIFFDYDEKDLLNISLTFVGNGNILESVYYFNSSRKGDYNEVKGNWFIENQKLIITNWDGERRPDDFSYKINNDNSLTITINGNSSKFYKKEDIIKLYPSLITDSWDNGRTDSGRERITFRGDGSGYEQSLYWEGRVFMSGSTFDWSYADETITAVYDNVATSIATKNYKIRYLNTKSLSWTIGNGSSFWLRD